MSLLRGGKEKHDENGNVVLDKNGKPKHELNWAYARKEGIRELVTGPSAFIIPLIMLTGIKKYSGRGNNVRLDYINSFEKPFTTFATNNLEAIKSGTPNKVEFYEEVFKDVIHQTINDKSVSKTDLMSAEEVAKTARNFAEKQIAIENIKADKTLGKKEKSAKIAEIGTVEEAFMKLKKGKIGGIVNELTLNLSSSKGIKTGSIGELLGSMDDYFDDAVKNTKKALSANPAETVENVLKHFTNRRMGSRFLTNLGIFGAVAAFFTQIPKLYNMGLKGNPALQQDAQPAQIVTTNAEVKNDSVSKDATKKDVSFTGNMGGMLEKAGAKVFDSKKAKSFSDIFELSGPVIQGSAMATLLYGFCIPPRLANAQDKYDYAEIAVRDMTAFTALLFGAKALARLFSDGFTKITGLALNHTNLEGRNVFQKIGDYLNPKDTRHQVLSSTQLDSKYTNLRDYKNGIMGFVEFIEQSGGNIKKAFRHDKNILETVSSIVSEVKGKSYKDATVAEIKEALDFSNKNNTKLMDKLYNLFEADNGLTRKSKTCNSAFGFLSTIVLVPSLIYWLTDFCTKMTERKQAKERELKNKAEANNVPTSNVVAKNPILTKAPTMAGFLNS